MIKIADWQKQLGPALNPLSQGYAWLMGRRAEAYAARGFGFVGPLARHFAGYTPKTPCLSVGNIAWGGTGKTPVVRWLGQWFIAHGLKPVVLTRGYGGRPARLPMAVNPHSLPEEAGDEALMLARSGIPVVVDPKRVRSAAWVEERFSPDVLIMDDGFQHLALARDLDLVLLTPHDLGAGWGRVLPAGTWREGAEALKRASAFLIHADPETFDDLQRDIALALVPLEKPVFAFHLRGKGLRLLGRYVALPPAPAKEAGAEETGTAEDGAVNGAAGGATARDEAVAPFRSGNPPDIDKMGLARDLAGAPYVLACGVGTPERVAATITEFLGYPPVEEARFGDHHAYTAADAAKLAALRARGLEIVCTAKDAVKLGPLVNFPLWVLEVEPAFLQSIEGLVWENWLADVWSDLRKNKESGSA